jgi:two-component system, chemotaxis family, chemotaxis protein CheY
MTILIVDDNMLMRRMIKDILTQPGVECIECADGESAIQRYREIRPAWVLMDIMMPGYNGIKATREIMKDDPDAHIAIVTNFDDKEYRAAAAEAGAQAYVLKEDLTRLRDVCLIKQP